MSNENYQRLVQVYEVPILDKVEILNPQNIAIKFKDSVAIDVGRLCYLKRGIKKKGNPWGKKQVQLESFCDDRVKTVTRLVEFASDMAVHSGLKGPTLHTGFSRLIGFADWGDSISAGDIFSSKEHAQEIFKLYVDFWRDRYSRSEVSQNAAAKQMSEVASMLGRYFDDDTFGRGFNFIRHDNNTKEPTLPPDTFEQGRTLALCNAIFAGIYDLVINKKNYPYPLKVPEYLAFADNTLWLFPSRDWFRTPDDLAKGICSGGFDYSKGVIMPIEQLAIEYPEHGSIHRILVNAIGLVSVGNVVDSKVRLRMAASALNAYVVMFFAETGMTGSELRGLRWDDDYTVRPSRQGFRAIKWRAYGREGVFELSLSGTIAFQQFLKLREFLLQGQKFEYLFFRKRYSKKQPASYTPSLIGTYQFLKRVDPHAQVITVRRWRAAKSDWLIRNTDPSVAAMILQNSEKTVLQHYAEGSETAFHDEMSLVLSKLSSVVTSPMSLEKVTDGPLCSCTDFGEPSAIIVSSSVEPNCKSPEGCLFCEKFKVHPDEEDARKLLSCRYVINMMSPSSGSYEDFEVLLRPTLTRIDMILAEISEKDAELVLRVSREVEEFGELSSYWSSKAQMLMAMGD